MGAYFHLKNSKGSWITYCQTDYIRSQFEPNSNEFKFDSNTNQGAIFKILFFREIFRNIFSSLQNAWKYRLMQMCRLLKAKISFEKKILPLAVFRWWKLLWCSLLKQFTSNLMGRSMVLIVTLSILGSCSTTKGKTASCWSVYRL